MSKSQNIVNALLTAAPSMGGTLGQQQAQQYMRNLVGSVRNIEYAAEGQGSSYNKDTDTVYIKRGLGLTGMRDEFAHEMGHVLFKTYQSAELNQAYKDQNLMAATYAMAGREAMAVAFEYTSGLSENTGYVQRGTVESLYLDTAAAMPEGSTYESFMETFAEKIRYQMLLQDSTRSDLTLRAFNWMELSPLVDKDEPPPPATLVGADIYSESDQVDDYVELANGDTWDSDFFPDEQSLADDIPDLFDIEVPDPVMNVRVFMDGVLQYEGEEYINRNSTPIYFGGAPECRLTVFVAGQLYIDDYYEVNADAVSIAQRAVFSYNFNPLGQPANWNTFVLPPGYGMLSSTGTADLEGFVDPSANPLTLSTAPEQSLSTPDSSTDGATQLIQAMSQFGAVSAGIGGTLQSDPQRLVDLAAV